MNATLESHPGGSTPLCAVVATKHVQEHLKSWGLETKQPERLGSVNGVRVLGLRVDCHLQWKRDNVLPDVGGQPLTRRQMHKILGE